MGSPRAISSWRPRSRCYLRNNAKAVAVFVSDAARGLDAPFSTPCQRSTTMGSGVDAQYGLGRDQSAHAFRPENRSEHQMVRPPWHRELLDTGSGWGTGVHWSEQWGTAR